jgi:ethanolamine ammonia-lyase large subunit
MDEDELLEEEAETNIAHRTRKRSKSAKGTVILKDETMEEIKKNARSELVKEADLLRRIFQDNENGRVYEVIALEGDAKHKSVVGIRQAIDDDAADPADADTYYVEGENGISYV